MWIVVRAVANGASSSRPETHWDSVPGIVTSPPVGRPGHTWIGGAPVSDSTRTPICVNASSSGTTGRWWKYFCPVTVTGASASAASPIMKYSVVPELPAVTESCAGWYGPPSTTNVSPSMTTRMPSRRSSSTV